VPSSHSSVKIEIPILLTGCRTLLTLLLILRPNEMEESDCDLTIASIDRAIEAR